MIVWSEIDVEDENLARSVLLYAVTVAPCVTSLDGEPKLNALAILDRTAQDLAERPKRHLKTQARGPWSAGYYSSEQIGAALTADDRLALQALCGAGAARGPVGHFPEPSPALGRLWPEER